MRSIGKLPGESGFQVLVFFFFILLFSWPFWTTPVYCDIGFRSVYLFLVWALLILFIFVVSRCLRLPTATFGDEYRGGKTDV